MDAETGRCLPTVEPFAAWLGAGAETSGHDVGDPGGEQIEQASQRTIGNRILWPRRIRMDRARFIEAVWQLWRRAFHGWSGDSVG